MKRIFINFFFTMTLGLLSFVSSAETFTEGTNYTRVTPSSAVAANQPAGTISVIEFFSYACPHCADFEPILEKWLATKPANVVFTRVPAEWNRGWDNLAKAYYTAEQLKVTDKINPALFEAMKNRKLDPTNVDHIAALFKEKAGIAEDTFKKTFDSFGVNVSQTKGKQLMTEFKIRGVPAIIVGNRYLTDAPKAGSVEKIPEVINYLINLESTSAKK